MILTHGVKVCLATRPCDLRKSFDTLSVVVHDELREDPLSRKVFVFLNRNTRIRPKSGLGQALQYALGQ
jgi:transposase